VSLNTWVFRWRLKVRMFSHSRMSAGREFQVDEAATEKARRASWCVCEERPAAEHRTSADVVMWCRMTRKMSVSALHIDV